jgi:hypothetical protein
MRAVAQGVDRCKRDKLDNLKYSLAHKYKGAQGGRITAKQLLGTSMVVQQQQNPANQVAGHALQV